MRDAYLSGRGCVCPSRLKQSPANLSILLALFIPLFALAMCASGAAAEDVQLAQMVHTAWTAREGAPQRITSLAQDRDGSLWIGADGGLFRFDGLSFVAFHSPPGETAIPPGLVRSVFVSKDGTLWVGTRTGGLIEIRDGHVRIVKSVDDVPAASFHQILQSPNGTLWALAESRPIRLGGDRRWHWAAPSLKLPAGDTKDIFFDSQGTLWIAQTPDLYYLPAGSSQVEKSDIEIGVQPSFAQTSSGKLWLTDLIGHPLKGRLIEINPALARPVRLELSADHNSLFTSPDGSLWVSRLQIGLVRLRFQEQPGKGKAGASGTIPFTADYFDATQGLSSDTLTSFLRDQQGNIWAGGVRGLDRFQQPKLVPLSVSLPKGQLPPMDTDSSGTVWIAAPGSGLYSLHGTTLRPEYGKRNYWGVFCGPDHLIWFDDDAGLWQLRDGKATFVRPVYPATPTTLFQVVQQRPEIAFASLQNRNDPSLLGTFRIEGNQWRKIDFSGSQISVSESGMAKELSSINRRAPSIMLIDSHQRLWNGYTDGLVSLVDETHSMLFSSGSPGLGVVGCLLETKQGILAAGTNGVAVWRGTSFQMLRFKDADAASGVSGLVRSRNGDVWLNGSRGIGRIPYAELEAGLADPKHEIVTESITEGDYVGPAPFQLRLRTAFVDGNGTLWFIAPDGTPLHLDPEHIGSPLPQLSILNMVSDGVPVSPANVIPPKPNTLLIRYFGVDLAVPDKITYRYKLDGVDPAWQEVGRRTEAVYTRLRPGQYTFHVQASNGSGDWTPITSGVPFTVSPSFYQTGWFGASCLAVGLLLSWLLLHLRVQYVASQLNVRFDERLAERTRIARELHDTLLQGFQGLTLHFQGVMKQIPDELPARETMRKALGYADEVLTEARKRVRDLRAEGPISGDLSQDLTSYGEELARDKAVEFKITVVGTPQPLHPVAGDEIHRITREALANAFRHSQASSIEVEMTYEPAGFSLRVRDNGVGIDQEILNSGRQGHWGLSGMRERAQEVGGDWRIWSSAGKGTEIHLKVPARCAYVSREKVKRAGI